MGTAMPRKPHKHLVLRKFIKNSIIVTMYRVTFL